MLPVNASTWKLYTRKGFNSLLTKKDRSCKEFAWKRTDMFLFSSVNITIKLLMDTLRGKSAHCTCTDDEVTLPIDRIHDDRWITAKRERNVKIIESNSSKNHWNWQWISIYFFLFKRFLEYLWKGLEVQHTTLKNHSKNCIFEIWMLCLLVHHEQQERTDL